MNTTASLKKFAKDRVTQKGLKVVSSFLDGLPGQTAQVIVKRGIVYIEYHVDIIGKNQDLLVESLRQVRAAEVFKEECKTSSPRFYYMLSIDQRKKIDDKIFGYDYEHFDGTNWVA